MNASIASLPWDRKDPISRGQTLTYEDVAPLIKTNSRKNVRLSELILPDEDIVPNKHDILCGRDKQAFNHVGNKQFRVIIAKHRQEYQTAASREEKTRITHDIIDAIKQDQGRFLKQDPDTKQWYLVDKDYIHEKVSHALRSAKDPKEKKVARKRQKARPITFTQEEDDTFRFLLTEQQKIFQELLQEEFPSAEEPMDFAIIDEIGSNPSIAV